MREHYDFLADRYHKAKETYYFDSVLRIIASKMYLPEENTVDEQTLVTLDLGCGSGAFLEQMSQDSRCMLVGVDFSKRLLKSIPRNLSKKRNVNLILADLEFLPLRSNSANLAVCIDVVEHFRTLDQVFKEICRVLPEAGRLILITPNSTWGPVLELAEVLRAKLPEGPHLWAGKRKIMQYLRKNSFVLVDQGNYIPFPVGVPIVTSLIERGFGQRNRFGVSQVFVCGKRENLASCTT